MKLYQKLFFQTSNKRQLLVASFATFVGFLLLLIGTNYVFQINQYRAKNELITDNLFVVQRKISNGGAFKIQKNEFNKNDQEFIASQSFIDNFQPVTVNNFDIDLQLSDEKMPYLRTDIFVQSILSDFLDVKNISWSWSEKDEFVPIIIPKEFLVMMNTFMSGKGMPQISEEIAKSINFKFNIKKDGQKETIPCRVVGFTSVFSAVLVPTEFMNYSSEKYGREKEKVTQLILSHTKDGFGEFKQFLADNYLETKSTDLVLSQIKSMTLVLFNFVVVLAFIILFLSSTIFNQYSQLLIESKKYEIRTMLRLGHPSETISKTIFNYFLKIMLTISVCTFILFLILTYFVNHYFMKYGFDFSQFINFNPIWIFILINGVLLILIRNKIKGIISEIK